MRQVRNQTPNTSISNIPSKSHTDSKKEKNSNNTEIIRGTSKKKTQVFSATVSPTLKKLKKLRTQTRTNSISPLQAAAVIKDYIMPMFKLSRDVKHLRRRSEMYGTSSKTQDHKDAGIVSDFKLVQELSTELSKLQESNKIIQQQLKIAKQDRAVFDIDQKNLQDKLLSSETNIAFINFTYTQMIKKNNQESFNKRTTTDHYSKYKSLYEEEQKKFNHLSRVLLTEKTKSDKLKNIAVQLEYVNTLLVMENDIIGEKLKGLYTAIENLIGSNGASAKLAEEFRKISQNTCDMSVRLLQNNEVIKKMHEEKHELELLVNELGDITSGIEGRKDKYIKVLREKCNKLDSELKITTYQRDSLKSDHEDLQRKYSDLQSEHTKLLSKIKKVKTTFSSNLLEEKYCKNCQKAFMECNNFNWSCKRHASQITEEIFWCCGQKGKDAPGCVTSKHICLEDFENAIDKAEIQKVNFCAVSTM